MPQAGGMLPKTTTKDDSSQVIDQKNFSKVQLTSHHQSKEPTMPSEAELDNSANIAIKKSSFK